MIGDVDVVFAAVDGVEGDGRGEAAFGFEQSRQLVAGLDGGVFVVNDGCLSLAAQVFVPEIGLVGVGEAVDAHRQARPDAEDVAVGLLAGVFLHIAEGIANLLWGFAAVGHSDLVAVSVEYLLVGLNEFLHAAARCQRQCQREQCQYKTVRCVMWFLFHLPSIVAIMVAVAPRLVCI